MKDIITADVVIIGAGLSGLVSAAKLISEGSSVRILESRARIGGRIFTVGSNDNKPIELGATWLGAKHVHLIELLDSLGLETFKQRIGDKAFFEPISTSPPYIVSIPESSEPSYRIKGGSYSLIDKLLSSVGIENVNTSEKVLSIHSLPNEVEIRTQQASYKAKKVISTIPPNLLVNLVTFDPVLPQTLLDVAKSTHTWMDDSIKVSLSYDKPFWLDPGKSGTISSNVGPVHEMYDHSNFENDFFALKGFFNGSYYTLTKEQRLNKILSQLSKYYGAEANNYISYEERVWRNDENTFYPYSSHIVPHQNNGNAVYQSLYMNERLIISGTETSRIYPGYMEGAVYSGSEAAKLANQ